MEVMNKIFYIARVLCVVLFLSIAGKDVRAQSIEAMNRVEVPSFTDLALKGNAPEGQSAEKINLLILGNSLCIHGAAPGMGWNYTAGMAASSQEKDYVHLLCGKLRDKFGADVNCRFSNLAEFERNPETYDLRKIDKLLEIEPDYVIIQLGDNVSDLAAFEKACARMIRRIGEKQSRAVIICATPFFASAPKNQMVWNICGETSSLLVDFSHLKLSDPKNLAINEEGREDRTLWKVDGIGIHPGDYGMESIARRLLIEIQASRALQKKNIQKSF